MGVNPSQAKTLCFLLFCPIPQNQAPFLACSNQACVISSQIPFRPSDSVKLAIWHPQIYDLSTLGDTENY